MDRDSPHEATVADRGPASTEGFGNLALWWCSPMAFNDAPERPHVRVHALVMPGAFPQCANNARRTNLTVTAALSQPVARQDWHGKCALNVAEARVVCLRPSACRV